MQSLLTTIFVLFYVSVYLAPIAIGVAISFSAVGNDFRRNWFFIVIPAFCLLYGIFYVIGKIILSSNRQLDMGYATVVVSAWLLIPAARFFRLWKERNL